MFLTFPADSLPACARDTMAADALPCDPNEPEGELRWVLLARFIG